MKMNKEHGGISFGDLLTVACLGAIAYLVYSRGYLDGYLPEQYTARTVLLGGKGEEPEPAAAPMPVPEEAPVAEGRPHSAGWVAPTPFILAPVTTGSTATTAAEKQRAADEAVAVVHGKDKSAINLSKLDKTKLPLKVKLAHRTDFVVMINGKEAGKVSSPAGTMVRLVELRESDVLVEHGGSEKVIPIGDTDVLERIHAIISVSGATQGNPGEGFQKMKWNNMNKELR